MTTYNAASEVTKVTNPRGIDTTYSYDLAGQLVSVVDRLGQKKQFTYDAIGQVTAEDWFNASNTKLESRSFSYDANGNLLTAANPAGTYAMAYDALNRTTNVSGPFGSTLAFGYDANDNRVSVVDGLGGTTTSTFDGLDRLASREMSGTNITPVKATWGYNAAGDLTTLTRQSKVGGAWSTVATTTKGYDALGRLTSQATTKAGGGTISSYGFTYDAGDRLTSQTVNGTTKTYAYDKLDQTSRLGDELWLTELPRNLELTSVTGLGTPVVV
jgi:YD repeat-containing protein